MGCSSQNPLLLCEKAGKYFPRDFTGFRVVYPFAKFGADSPFHSGDIAAFVSGSQTFEIRETVRGENFPHTRSVVYTHRAMTRPLNPFARLWNEACKRGSAQWRI